MYPSMSVCLSVCGVLCHIVTITLDHIVTKVTLDHIVPKMILDTIVAVDTIVAFDIPMVTLLTSSLVMWRKELAWKFSVSTQRLHLSNLVRLGRTCYYT
jgi:hypothetical protein